MAAVWRSSSSRSRPGPGRWLAVLAVVTALAVGGIAACGSDGDDTAPIAEGDGGEAGKSDGASTTDGAAPGDGGSTNDCTDASAEFNRLGHLEHQLLLGGDLASRYPLRMAAAMLCKAGADVAVWLKQNEALLSYGDMEAELILNQLKKGIGGPQTTSCGRVLDAVSALLGVCTVRSYEGEPAMKLESAALHGKDALHLTPQIYGNVLGTSNLLWAIYNDHGKHSIPDLAYSAHVYLAKGLASLAIEQASEEGTKNVGFTGGAACNQILAEIIRAAIEAAGLNFYVHEQVPAGDGGVSFGQAVVASKRKF
jgi:hydrogenase maturation protein HypF